LSSNIPQSPSDLPEAEARIKRIKSEWNEQIEFRKSKTNKFEVVAKRMMIPEQSVKPEITAFESAIIAIKKVESTENAKAKAINDETARIRELFTNHISQTHAQFESSINSKVIKCFEKCLMDDIPPDVLPFDRMKAAFTLPNFTIYACQATSSLITSDDSFKIWGEIKSKYAKNEQHYLDMYHHLLAKQFEFYNVAFKNKEQSLALAKIEAAIYF